MCRAMRELLGNSSSFFTCTPCHTEAGFSNSLVAYQRRCTPCTRGRYTDGNASSHVFSARRGGTGILRLNSRCLMAAYLVDTRWHSSR